MSGEGDDFVEIAARAVEMRPTTSKSWLHLLCRARSSVRKIAEMRPHKFGSGELFSFERTLCPGFHQITIQIKHYEFTITVKAQSNPIQDYHSSDETESCFWLVFRKHYEWLLPSICCNCSEFCPTTTLPVRESIHNQQEIQDFPGGTTTLEGGCRPVIWQIFPKNCMKMKKFWAGGGRASLAPPRSSTDNTVASCLENV